jgi:hypothetical protein
VWRRERVGRTSKVVEAIGEDPTALGKAVVGEDPAAVGEAVVGEDPAAVGEAVGSLGGMEVDVVGEAWRRTQSVVEETCRRTRRGSRRLGRRGGGPDEVVSEATAVQAWSSAVEEWACG